MVLVPLVVLCLCRKVILPWFLISCHLLDETQSNDLKLTPLLHTSSTQHGPPPPPLSPPPCGTSHLQPQLPLLSIPVVTIIFSHLHERCRPHTSFLWLLFPTSTSPTPSSFHHRSSPPPPSVMDIFLDLATRAASLFSFRVCGLSHVALLTLFVLSAAKRERPEQNARLLLAASTSPSGPPSAPPHARL